MSTDAESSCCIPTADLISRETRYFPAAGCSVVQEEEPRDLTLKKKPRQVPPPLDLGKRNLDLSQSSAIHNGILSPKSPFLRKNLPLRKRYQVLGTYSWSSQPNLSLQTIQDERSNVTQSISEFHSSRSDYRSSSSFASLKIPGLPTPHTPQTPHPYSAIPITTSRFNFTENGDIGKSSYSGSNNNDLDSDQVPLNLSTTTSVGNLPSSLLSPAPSHPSSSSLNSSREELESEPMISDSVCLPSPLPTHVSSQSSVSHIAQGSHITAMDIKCEELVLPNHTNNNNHQWPTTVWSIFLAGVQVHFLLGGGKVTGAQMSEELGQWACHQHYAPHGLHLLKTIYEDHQSSYRIISNNHSLLVQLYFRPVNIHHQDIMVIAPIYHPFFVHGKGWCSLSVEYASHRYNVPCQQLMEGDICLPPHHPETTLASVSVVVTPDLTDAMKKFDFNDDHFEMQYQPSSCSALPDRSVFLSPPASPSKKSKGIESTFNLHSIGENSQDAIQGGVKSRRPMNGFMLFAKHHRLKLIQQHPGKDNRAISVILGGMWKSLPDEDREKFIREARIQAEERKRLDPDCWKRKRSHSTS